MATQSITPTITTAQPPAVASDGASLFLQAMYESGEEIDWALFDSLMEADRERFEDQPGYSEGREFPR